MTETPPGAPPRACRQLVVCCDGTNNTLTAGVADTNVLKLHAWLVAHPAPGFERLLFYDPGVGVPDAAPPTDPFDWARRSAERVAALASGRGVYDNISAAYRFLMQNWREGDQIWCFGFSRGAFTARCVVGMVNLFGVVRPEHESLLPTLIHTYFSLPPGPAKWWQDLTRRLRVRTARRAPAGGVPELDGRQDLARQVRALFASPAGAQAWVHWVGVWDTVESVGLPGPLSRSNPSTATFTNKRVRHARHALAFDEHRWTFVPRLYEEPGDVVQPGRSLEQRWFPGVHCDVGGSYKVAESGLSDRAFAWIVNEAADELGVPRVEIDESAVAPQSRRHDALHDTPWWALAGMCVRDMQPTTEGGAAVAIIPAEPRTATTSVWDERRPLWPVGVALVASFVLAWLSGRQLIGPGSFATPFENFLAASDAGRVFAFDQLAALWFGGLLESGRAPWEAAVRPAWAMFWDLGFIAAYGYVLARIASRAFTWLAGERTPGASRRRWLLLGMAPLAAVGGDVAEDACTLLALLAHGADVHWLAATLLWIGGLAACLKFAGLAGCAALAAVRAWMVVAGGTRVGAVR